MACRPSLLPALLLALLCAQPCPCGRAPASSKAVTARLAAKWPATPLLLEASEFIAEDGNEKFWQFLETVRELTVYKQGEHCSVLESSVCRSKTKEEMD